MEFCGLIIPILSVKRIFGGLLKNIENMVIEWTGEAHWPHLSLRASYAVWKTFLGVDRNASAPITMAERWQRTLSEICLGLTAYRMSSRSHKCIYFIGCDGASAPRRTGDEEGLSSQLSIKNTPGQKYTWINHKPHRLGSTLLQRSNTIVFQAKTTPISSYTCIINIIWNKKD